METPRWLQAIQRALQPRMLLGRRLNVIAPTYVDFTVTATVLSLLGRDPSAVQKDIETTLIRRLQLIDPRSGSAQREFGVTVSRSDVSAWLRSVPGVQRVLDVSVLLGSGPAAAPLNVPPRGLPRFDFASSAIRALRQAPGAV